MTTRLTIRKPDDWHLHVRDGAMLEAVLPFTACKRVTRVLERMEKIGMPFLMHGEDVDPEVDIFDREAMFIERYLSKWTRQFPGLRFVLEHLSSKDGVDFVRSTAPQVGGTI